MTIVGGCGACGRRPARWATRMRCPRQVGRCAQRIVHKSSCLLPAPKAPAPVVDYFNSGVMVRTEIGSIRTSIQGPGGSNVAATAERVARGGRAGGRRQRRHAGALAESGTAQTCDAASVDGRGAAGIGDQHRSARRIGVQRLMPRTRGVPAAVTAMA